MRGLDRTEAMLAVLAQRVPLLGVDRARCADALDAGALATDEVMRRVRRDSPFGRRIARWSASSVGGAGSRRRRRRGSSPAAGPPADSATWDWPRLARGCAQRAAGAGASGGGSTRPCDAWPAAGRRPAGGARRDDRPTAGSATSRSWS